VAALAAESRHLGSTKRCSEAVASLGDGTLLAVSGMGAAAAGQGARALVAAGARALISWGMAGGLDPTLEAGAIFLPGEVISADGASFPTTGHWRQRLSTALAAYHPVTSGKLLTSREAIGSAADKANTFRKTGAAAVDMESAAVAEVAKAHGLPLLVVRVIVDTAADSLPQAVVAAADGAGPLRIARLLGSVACAPQELPRLIRLARRYRAANRSLAAVAQAGPLAPDTFANASRDRLP